MKAWAESLRSEDNPNARMVVSSVALMAARAASSGLGFLAWLVAARLFIPEEVGLASGSVAAMMLCVQLALVGIGSALIGLYPAHRETPTRLIDTAFTSVATASVVVAIAFLWLAGVALDEFRAIATMPLLAGMFLGMALFGTLNTLYDHVSVALRRGDQVLVRNVAFGLVTIAALLLSQLTGSAGASVIMLAWMLAGFTACVLGWVQLGRSLRGYRYTPSLDLGLSTKLVRTGVPNWLLTLTERVPALMMPVLVTEVFSPEVNAYWYAAWMMAWVVMIIPISMGQSLFAEASHRPADTEQIVARAVRTALLLGGVAAGVLVIFAGVALSLLGPRYAEAGELALRILVLSVVPFTVTQSYYAICRARGKLREAIAAGALTGTAAVVASMLAGTVGGLPAMAGAWVLVQGLAGAWAGFRLRVLARPVLPVPPPPGSAHGSIPETGPPL